MDMKNQLIVNLSAMVILFTSGTALSQAFGEYGRAVGSVPHGQGITGSRSPGGVTQGNAGGGGVGDIGGRALPARLVVAAKSAALFPRQDDESDAIANLPRGESLVPMVQTAGGSAWYMVKTQKGLVGWIRGVDVREAKPKK